MPVLPSDNLLDTDLNDFEERFLFLLKFMRQGLTSKSIFGLIVNLAQISLALLALKLK